MYKKPIKLLLLLAAFFAILTIFCGFMRLRVIAAGNFGGYGNIVMLKSDFKNEYIALVKELDGKYLEKFCDVFSDAKNSLLKKADEELGEAFKNLKEELLKTRSSIKVAAENYEKSEAHTELQQRLVDLKEKLLSATDSEKEVLKLKINEVLSEITARNMENISELAKMRREFDALTEKAVEQVKSKSETFKKIQKEVLEDAKEKTLKLSVAYKGEKEALSKAFGVEEYSVSLPFLDKFSLDMRIIDFDKQEFIERITGKKTAFYYAKGSETSQNDSSKPEEEKLFFKSDEDWTVKN